MVSTSLTRRGGVTNQTELLSLYDHICCNNMCVDSPGQSLVQDCLSCCNRDGNLDFCVATLWVNFFRQRHILTVQVICRKSQEIFFIVSTSNRSFWQYRHGRTHEFFSRSGGIEFNNVNITQPFGVYFPIHLYPQVGLTSLQAPMGRGWVKSLDNGWSKSIILENKVF